MRRLVVSLHSLLITGQKRVGMNISRICGAFVLGSTRLEERGLLSLKRVA